MYISYYSYSYICYHIFFFVNDTSTTHIYTYLHTLSLHDALPISYYPTSTPFFHDLTVQPERRSIELTAYHTRLRLQANPVDSERTKSDSRSQPGDRKSTRLNSSH